MNQSKTTAVVLTLFGLLGALYPFLVWIFVGMHFSHESQEEKRQIFYRHFPKGWEQSHYDLYLMPLFAFGAVYGSVLWMKRTRKGARVLPVIFLVVSCFMAAISLFQLL